MSSDAARFLRLVGFAVPIILSPLQRVGDAKESLPGSALKLASPNVRNGLAYRRSAETARQFQGLFHVNAKGDTLRYRLLTPPGMSGQEKYPLVLCLSGSRGRGTDNHRQIGGCWPAQVLAGEEAQQKYPCFVLVPQCPPRKNWRIAGGVGKHVMEVLEQIQNSHPVDAERVYVTGQSMGGFGSWEFLTAYPQKFAAAIPICGGGKPFRAAEFAHVPIWVFHGAKDTSVPVSRSREMISALKRAGASPNYTEFPDAGHTCWPLVFDSPDVLDWLFAQRRIPSGR